MVRLNPLELRLLGHYYANRAHNPRADDAREDFASEHDVATLRRSEMNLYKHGLIDGVLVGKKLAVLARVQITAKGIEHWEASLRP